VHCPSSIVPAGPAIISLLTYFEMIANVMGLGTVWAGYFMVAAGGYEPIKEYLKIPKDNTIYGSMMFGYPAVNYDLIPQRPEINLSWY
jgi:nitroreductase